MSDNNKNIFFYILGLFFHHSSGDSIFRQEQDGRAHKPAVRRQPAGLPDSNPAGEFRQPAGLPDSNPAGEFIQPTGLPDSNTAGEFRQPAGLPDSNPAGEFRQPACQFRNSAVHFQTVTQQVSSEF